MTDPDRRAVGDSSLGATGTSAASPRVSEAWYRLLAEVVPNIVVLADAERRLIYANPAYTSYTGIASAEVGSRWADAIHPDDLPAIARARATGDAYGVEYRLRRHDGTYRWHFASTTRVPGEPTGWLGIAIDIDDRKRAEEWARFVERAGSRLSRSLDVRRTCLALVELAVPDYGAYASITLDEWLESDGPVAECGEGRLRAAPGAMTLPIVADDVTIGSLRVAHADTERQPADAAALEELARLAGFAIGNALLYEREHRVASVLQEAALPRTLPDVAGISLDAHYRAGRAEASIGGDWFDAFELGDGRIVLSVGDVTGNGLKAAVRMGNVRQLLRGAAHAFDDPLQMLDLTDRTLRSERETPIVTAFIGVVDPIARTLHYASAGHVPAMLRASDGTVAWLATNGLPLGCRDMGTSRSDRVALPPGSRLLLYTDGLVESTHDLLAGEATLRRCFAAMDPDAYEQPARALVERVIDGHVADDDIAVLLLTMDDASGRRNCRPG